MGIPLCIRMDTEPERMVIRKTEVIGTSCVHERESTGRQRVPRVRRNHIEGRSQLCPKRLIHTLCPSLDCPAFNHWSNTVTGSGDEVYLDQHIATDQQLPLYTPSGFLPAMTEGY